MQHNPGSPKSFKATEALEAYRRVKLSAGSGNEVEYADAGEDYIGVTTRKVSAGEYVACWLKNADGTVQVEAADSFSVGATLYGANDGKVSDTSSGSAQFTALVAAGGDGEVIEALPMNVKSTTAATVSIADSGGFTASATVEAALAELYQHVLSKLACILIPLAILRELSSGAIPNVAANGGLLASDTTPILNTVNGDTDGAFRVNWAAGNQDPIGFQVPLPKDFDDSADLLIRIRAASESTNDTPTFASDAYFDEGDTKVEDTSDAVSDSYADKTITIAAADIPSGARTISVELTPGSHATDALYVTAIWLEYKRKLLTS